MIVNVRRNVQHALIEGLMMIKSLGHPRQSRNGDVLQMPEPVTTVYTNPRERVLFNPERDANPFFHFYESLWMLAGRKNVSPLIRYVKRMKDFSDDGRTFNAAYGNRWFYIEDQPMRIIDALSNNKNDRRCVLQIWDKSKDLFPYRGKDAACNIAATFQIDLAGQLEMTVFCRSNDAIWGAWGANAVHFSMLQEFIATGIGVPVGRFNQISVNLHGYLATMQPLLDSSINRDVMYEENIVKPYPLMTCGSWTWRSNCMRFITHDGRAPQVQHYTDPFFYNVALPIVRAHDAYKDIEGSGRFDQACEELSKCKASDWRTACSEWINRRRKNWTLKQSKS